MQLSLRLPWYLASCNSFDDLQPDQSCHGYCHFPLGHARTGYQAYRIIGWAALLDMKRLQLLEHVEQSSAFAMRLFDKDRHPHELPAGRYLTCLRWRKVEFAQVHLPIGQFADERGSGLWLYPRIS
jgi:hypothetical protein